jgi:hypothetical protein
MLKPPFFWALALLLAGCTQEAAPPPVSASTPPRTFVWNVEERPYEVLAVSVSDVPRLGDQARNAESVYPNPQSREEVEKALQEIYRELKSDIEQSQRDAEFRRISILIYDSKGDQRYDPDAFLCHLALAPEPGEPLPVWPGDAVTWQWRDPASRPEQASREIEWEYIDTLEDINRNVIFPVMKSPDVTAREHRANLEQTYQAESEELKRQLAEKHGLSVGELEALLDRLLKWKYEGGA